MASDLQVALIGAGATAVALVWAYNAWQDRQHRRTAERIFREGGSDAAGSTTDAPPVERREPSLPVADGTVPQDAGEPQGELPAQWADEVADCIVSLRATQGLPAPAVWAVQTAWSGDLSKTLRWLARDPGAAWRLVDAHDAGRYGEWIGALQLVDRRGPVTDGELGRFLDGMNDLARQTGAAIEAPPRGETLIRAEKLDEFCAGLDIQFVLHVVDASGGVLSGARLRAAAESAGLALEDDGAFHARDDQGGELFSVGNLGAELFEASTLDSLATHGLTLRLDVPRTVDGGAAFDAMLGTARQLAAALDGSLVDAQRAPLADAMIEAIRAKTAELQQRLREAGIAPGGALALRLFS